MNTIEKLTLYAVLGCTIFVTSCNSSKKQEPAGKKSETKQAVAVKTMIAGERMITRYIDFTSSLIPFEEVHLAPSSPGRIEKIDVEIGNSVTKGQVVALMDRTNLEQARINLMKIETDFRRLDTLKKTNSISDQLYDQAKSANDMARNTYQSLLENTQLKAPFSGVVSGKYFEDGEIYSGSPVATVGKPAILSIIQINQLKALIGISSSYYPLVKPGMKADVTCDIYPNLTFRGEIFRIYPTIDNATKTFTVEVKIQNDQLKLRPGMFSKIRLNLGEGKAILIPNIALVKQTGTNDMYVFVNRQNIAIKIPVQTGRMMDDMIEIIEGVVSGDEVVVIGQNKLEDQTPLLVKN